MSKVKPQEQTNNTQQKSEDIAGSAAEFLRQALNDSMETTVNAPDPWFSNLKKAQAAFKEYSNGELELLDNVYRGDVHRHQVFHHACGHHSWISLRELQALPFGTGCPHCHGTEDLTRFGSMENLQVSVYRQSGNTVYFFGCNPMGAADKDCIFWCIRHRQSYEATFAEFQRTRLHTNGCPLCAKDAGELSG